jgi:hypothetical protein
MYHKRPFAYIWPPNGQTAETRPKLSPPLPSPFDLSPEKRFLRPSGLPRRVASINEILPRQDQLQSLVFLLLRLLQKVNGAQCQQLSLAVLLASWSSVTRPVPIAPLHLGVVAAEAGGEPAPEIQIDPVASVSHKSRGLCALQDALLTICFFLYFPPSLL